MVTKNDVKIDHKYVYNIDTSGISYLKISMEEKEPINMAMLGLISFGITVLAGVISLLAFKINTDIKNKRELEKVQKESQTTMEE